ncbi:hypothetical protein SEPCBS119000_006752, partial [Sporothrix epigloea]
MSVPSIEQLCERLEKVYKKDNLAAAAGVLLCEKVPGATKAMASDIPVEYGQPQHYICDAEERRRLFAEIKPFFPFVVEANSTVLAVFMVCPLSELRSLAESLSEYDVSSEDGRLRYECSPPYFSLWFGLRDACVAIAGFLAKPTRKTTPRTASPVTTPRGVAQKRKRKASEGQSGTPSPLHKRVLPANTEGGPAVRSAEPVSQEIPAVSPSTPEKTVLIPASPAIRSHNAATRAKTRDDRRPTMLSSGSLDEISALCGGGTDSESWGRPPVAHRKSGLPLETGQIFTIRAEDPEDLPSFELLELQWDLLRIAAMSGPAEAQDEEWDEDEQEYGSAGNC